VVEHVISDRVGLSLKDQSLIEPAGASTSNYLCCL